MVLHGLEIVDGDATDGALAQVVLGLVTVPLFLVGAADFAQAAVVAVAALMSLQLVVQKLFSGLQ